MIRLERTKPFNNFLLVWRVPVETESPKPIPHLQFSLGLILSWRFASHLVTPIRLVQFSFDQVSQILELLPKLFLTQERFRIHFVQLSKQST